MNPSSKQINSGSKFLRLSATHALIVFQLLFLLSLSSCKKDDITINDPNDGNTGSVDTTTNNPGPQENSYTITGGPFNDYKVSFDVNSDVNWGYAFFNDSTNIGLISATNWIAVVTSGTHTGTYNWDDISKVNISLYANSLNYTILTNLAPSDGTISISVFGKQGEHIKGTFSGSAQCVPSTGEPFSVTISGKFDVLRTI
jgi:hypothetical protein